MASNHSAPKRRWTAEDRALLRQFAERGRSALELAVRLGRSTGAVQQKALEMGLRLLSHRASPVASGGGGGEVMIMDNEEATRERH